MYLEISMTVSQRHLHLRNYRVNMGLNLMSAVSSHNQRRNPKTAYILVGVSFVPYNGSTVLDATKRADNDDQII